MSKLIEIDPWHFVEVDDDDIDAITKATNAGLTVTDVPINPNNYLADDSDRPENIGKAQREADAKAEQDNINETINRPNIISALDEIPYQELQKAARDVLPYDQLAEYYESMITKQRTIYTILEEKGLEHTIENYNTEGAKTKADLETEIKSIRDARAIQ